MADRPIDPATIHYEQLVQIGWLDGSPDYPRGRVSAEFMTALVALLVNPWQPYVSPGIHHCPYCEFSGGPGSFSLRNSNMSVPIGSSNIYVPANGFLYVAPSLIVHYVDSHQYCPPENFQECVLRCPAMRSMEYLKAIRANGPKDFAKWIREPR